MFIKIPLLINKYSISINGLIHVGAHLAEEAYEYANYGIPNVIWVESNPDLIEKIREKLKSYDGQTAFNELIWSKDSIIKDFNITNNTESSSILDLKDHKKYYPEINTERTIKLETIRLDTFFSRINMDPKKYNFLLLDIQGSELEALKGLGKHFENFDYIYLEVSLTTLYDGNPLLSNLDRYLSHKGFIRRELCITDSGWGEAFYIKSKFKTFDLLRNLKQSYILQFKQKYPTLYSAISKWKLILFRDKKE